MRLALGACGCVVVLAGAAYAQDLTQDASVLDAGPMVLDAGAQAPEAARADASQEPPAEPPQTTDLSAAYTEPSYPVAPLRFMDRTPYESGKWYGWQTLIVDALGIGTLSLFFVVPDRNQETALNVGFPLWMFGSPIVHFAHDRVGRGFASFGLRAAPFAFLVYALVCAWGSDSDDGCLVLVGMAVAAIPAAITIDAAVLAFEKGPVSKAPVRLRTIFTLGPWRDAARDGWGLQLAAVF
jgi:hypothetical protein